MLGTRGDSTSLGRVGRARVVGSAVVVVVLATWLSGCESDAASPPPMETSTRSPSATPSPTPIAPTLPAEAKGTTEASAEAFVRHYIDVTNYAMATGDTAALRAVSGSSCVSCQGVIDRIDSVYGAGGSIESGGWELRSVSVVPRTKPSEPQIDVGLFMTPQRVTQKMGNQPSAFPGGRLPATFMLRRDGESWIVTEWERAA